MEDKLSADINQNIEYAPVPTSEAAEVCAPTEADATAAVAKGEADTTAAIAEDEADTAAPNESADDVATELTEEEFIIPDGPTFTEGDDVKVDEEAITDEPRNNGEAVSTEADEDALVPQDDGSADEDISKAIAYENDAPETADEAEPYPTQDAPTDVCPAPIPPMKEERYNPDRPRKIDFIFDFLELFVFTLVAVLIVTTFFVRHSVVEGDSMLNTLHNGDTLIISDLFYEPECGDIIVIESTELGKAIVKRVIAVGGQRVTVKPNGIYVNGELLNEADYVYTDGNKYLYDTEKFGKLSNNPTFKITHGSHYEFVVPEGEVFVMGDHRSDSKDSRDLGTLPVDAILGKVLWRVLPFDAFGSVD